VPIRNKLTYITTTFSELTKPKLIPVATRS